MVFGNVPSAEQGAEIVVKFGNSKIRKLNPGSSLSEYYLGPRAKHEECS